MIKRKKQNIQIRAKMSRGRFTLRKPLAGRRVLFRKGALLARRIVSFFFVDAESRRKRTCQG